jgi:tRNA (guanine-N7-)-methyltransferase
MSSTDDDYGVPISGAILPPEKWAKTALKKLPPPGPLDWSAIFGREAPIVLDLGCGNGRFVITSALARPEMDHLGVDILPLVLRYATRRANQRGLSNVRFAAIGGDELLAQYVAPASIAEIHLYHPQPRKERLKKHERLVTQAFFEQVRSSLAPGGLVVIQTDNRDYWQSIRQLAPMYLEWEELERPWPDAPQGRTRREIYARRKGMKIYRGQGRTPNVV